MRVRSDCDDARSTRGQKSQSHVSSAQCPANPAVRYHVTEIGDRFDAGHALPKSQDLCFCRECGSCSSFSAVASLNRPRYASFHDRMPLHNSLRGTPRAFAKRRMITSVGLRTPRSIPLMYVGSRSALSARRSCVNPEALRNLRILFPKHVSDRCRLDIV